MEADLERMQTIASPLGTVAAKIRALDAAGYARADIARFLGKRYQHVRNVLEDDAQRAGGGYVLGRADLSGLRDEPTAFNPDADERTYVERRSGGNYRLIVRTDGSLVLPPEVVEKLRAGPGEVVMGRLDGDEFNLVSVEAAIREVQELVARYVPKGVSLVDRYLKQKYEDAAREAERDDGHG